MNVILALTALSLAPDLEFSADAWPLVSAARKGTCDLPRMRSVAAKAPLPETPLSRDLLGRLELALALCSLFEKNDTTAERRWTERARATFGRSRPHDLHPAFATLLEGVGLGSSIQTDLLEQLGIENGESVWVPNLPFFGDRRPGASFLVSSPPYPVEAGTRKAAYVTAQKLADVSVPFGTDRIRSLHLGARLTELLEPVAASGRLQGDDVQLLTMPAPLLKHWVEEHESIQARIDNKQEPLVVARAFEASVAYRVKRQQLSKPRWAALARDVQSVVRSRHRTMRLEAGEEEMVLRLQERQVLLYQTMLGSYIADHLGDLDATLQLETVGPTALFAAPEVVTPVEEELPWDLVTISSGFYPAAAKLDQPWNRTSARLVQQALLPYHPRAVHELHATEASPLTRARRDRFIAGLRVKTSGARLVVVYIISHGATFESSDLMLRLAGPKGATKDAQNGLLSLEALQRRLGVLNRPHALLVDSCLPEKQIADYREALGFRLQKASLILDYAGPNALITNELTDLGARMREWGEQRDYLASANPIVFGAKPGVFTPVRPHPVDPFGPPVGPLAARLWRTSRSVLHMSDGRNIERVLRLSVDSMGGIGEITTRGTMSWSDFAGFRRALWPQPSPKAAAKRLLHVPGLTHVTVAGPSATLLLTWMGEDGWSFGYWKPGMAKPTTLVENLHFPSVAGTLDSAFVHDASEHEWSRHRIVDGAPKPEAEPVSGARYVSEASADWGQLLVMSEDGSVDVNDPLLALDGGRFRSVAIGPGEDVKDVTQWPFPSYVVALDDRTELVQLDGKLAKDAGSCGTRLEHLAPGMIALYGVAADGRTVCRFSFDWAVQKRDLRARFGQPIDVDALHSFEVRGEELLFGIGEDIWVVPNAAFGWEH